MYTKLSFTNFRGFKSLELDGLKRVNLIVGKNNAGKTSLLEGILLLGTPDLLVEQAEIPDPFRVATERARGDSANWLIHDDERESRLTFGYQLNDLEESTLLLYRKAPPKELIPGFRKRFQVRGCAGFTSSDYVAVGCSAISAGLPLPDDLVKPFADAIRSREGKDRITRLLRSVDSRIDEVRLDVASNMPFVAVDVGLRNLVPLTQAGQGIYRLVSVYSSLLSSLSTIGLIDEIENGLHYTALPQVWQGLAEVAEQLDLQLFVTTHSNECLEAAHAAFAKRDKYDFSVIQLMLTDEGVTGRVLGREMIETGLDANIDLR